MVMAPEVQVVLLKTRILRAEAGVVGMVGSEAKRGIMAEVLAEAALGLMAQEPAAPVIVLRVSGMAD
jgi:hypothetical protein